MFEFNATMLVAMISFVVFMFLMNTIFYQPILNIVRKRESYINSNYSQSQELNEEAKKHETEHDEKLAQTKDDAAKQTALALDKLQKETFAKTQQEKDNAKNEVSAQKAALSQAGSDLQNRVNDAKIADLASIITSKILKR